ncbi:MAG: phosphotransferase [Lewinellaceae bacterium]|nr:phosphotransferase [Lewinellaceae bacterium]
MLLSGANICYYLLDKGHLSVQSFIDGDFSVHFSPSRNNNFIINKAASNPLFVKQARNQDWEKQETLRHEATCYWLANNEPEYGNLKRFLPQYFEYDYINHILVLEYLQHAVPLDEYYAQAGVFPAVLAEKKAELLASYHKDIFTKIKNGRSFSLFKQSIPAVFMLVGNRQKFWTDGNNAAERQMLELINDEPQFTRLVGEVKESWQATSLIHSDIKAANFLISINASHGSATDNLRLIDWEMADIGDPCWDVAAVFQMYFISWIYSELNDGPGSNNPQSSMYYHKLLPAIRHFWDSYCGHMNYSAGQAEENLLKTMNFCALKLIHTCFESTTTSEHLPPSSAKMLQLSLNMLKSPEEAIQTLLDMELYVK